MKKAKQAAVQYQIDVTPQATTIRLEASLVARLREAAEWKGVSLEEAAQEAALSYIGRYGRAKVEKEQATFEQQKSELLKKYRGRYVAMHNGEVVETAASLRALRNKVFAHFGYTPMLHTLVTDEPDREIVVRSPRVDMKAMRLS
jgi:hypothetical protein